MACVNCGINIAQLEPRSFSFNSSYGACKRCQGLGTVMEIDANKIVPDQNQKTGKMTFLGGVDKTSGNFLQSALNAIIEKFTDGDELGQPSDTDPEKRGRGDAAKKKLKSIFSKMTGKTPTSK